MRSGQFTIYSSFLLSFFNGWGGGGGGGGRGKTLSDIYLLLQYLSYY